MRLGKNPARYQRSDRRPARVTVCVLVFIPEQFGYFQHRFNILKLSLRSILAHTPTDTYDLFVFDNGSCAEVVDYLRSLQQAKLIEYLFLSSTNLGVANAQGMIFQSAPGEIIAYSDDDALFEPGWLEAHLAVLESFPHVGMVSGCPVRGMFTDRDRHLSTYLDEHPQVSATPGRFIPEEWTREFRLSTGRPERREKESEREAERERQLTEVLLECGGVKAYPAAGHFQFLAPKKVLLQGLDEKWERRLMGGQKELDERIDALGYARLTTMERYVRHMGNVVTEDFLASVPEVGSESIKAVRVPRAAALQLAQTRVGRAALTRLNNWSYARLKHPR